MALVYDEKEQAYLVVPGTCPYTWPGDDGSAQQCVRRGHCGCDEAYKPENRQRPAMRTRDKVMLTLYALAFAMGMEMAANPLTDRERLLGVAQMAFIFLFAVARIVMICKHRN